MEAAVNKSSARPAWAMDPRELSEARALLARHLPRTRMIRSASLGTGTGHDVYLKLECEMPTGSFKVRGALYALQTNLQRGQIEEVVACSTGNHGAAVAWAAKLLGVKARIFLPEKNNPVKRAKIAALGAEIVEQGAADLAAAWAAAAEYSRRTGAYFLNDAADADVPVGPGTIACEILEEVPQISRVFVPMGDTALIRGVAAAAKTLKPGVKITGVQSEEAPSYFLSWKEGRAIATDTCDTIADGLATRTPLAANVEAIRALVDDVVLVSEQEMLQAIARLAIEEHVVAEPAGAAAMAAFLKSNGGDGPAALLVTGANIPREVLRRAMNS